MKEENRSPADLGNGLGVSPRELRGWLGRKPGTLESLSAFTAASGVGTTDSLLGRHNDYVNHTGRVSTIREMLLSRLGTTTKLKEVG